MVRCSWLTNDKKGRKLNEKFLKKYGAIICMIAVAVAPMASEFCRVKYYQPKEPEGLDKLLLKVQKNYE